MASRRITTRVMAALHRGSDIVRLRGFFHTMTLALRTPASPVRPARGSSCSCRGPTATPRSRVLHRHPVPLPRRRGRGPRHPRRPGLDRDERPARAGRRHPPPRRRRPLRPTGAAGRLRGRRPWPDRGGSSRPGHRRQPDRRRTTRQPRPAPLPASGPRATCSTTTCCWPRRRPGGVPSPQGPRPCPLHSLIVKPTAAVGPGESRFGGGSVPPSREELRRAIELRPWAVGGGEEALPLSTAPVVTPSGLKRVRLVLRTFTVHGAGPLRTCCPAASAASLPATATPTCPPRPARWPRTSGSWRPTARTGPVPQPIPIDSPQRAAYPDRRPSPASRQQSLPGRPAGRAGRGHGAPAACHRRPRRGPRHPALEPPAQPRMAALLGAVTSITGTGIGPRAPDRTPAATEDSLTLLRRLLVDVEMPGLVLYCSRRGWCVRAVGGARHQLSGDAWIVLSRLESADPRREHLVTTSSSNRSWPTSWNPGWPSRESSSRAWSAMPRGGSSNAGNRIERAQHTPRAARSDPRDAPSPVTDGQAAPTEAVLSRGREHHHPPPPDGHRRGACLPHPVSRHPPARRPGQPAVGRVLLRPTGRGPPGWSATRRSLPGPRPCSTALPVPGRRRAVRWRPQPPTRRDPGPVLRRDSPPVWVSAITPGRTSPGRAAPAHTAHPVAATATEAVGCEDGQRYEVRHRTTYTYDDDARGLLRARPAPPPRHPLPTGRVARGRRQSRAGPRHRPHRPLRQPHPVPRDPHTPHRARRRQAHRRHRRLARASPIRPCSTRTPWPTSRSPQYRRKPDAPLVHTA